jgi:hypothetical protein
VYIVQHFITPTCFGACAPSSGSLYIVLLSYNILKLLKTYKAVSRRMVKSVLLICYNFSNTIYKLSGNGAEAPKHVRAFVI